MSDTDLKNMNDLDEAAEKAGGFVSLLNSGDINYDYRGIIKYCKEKGIEPVDMTIREFNAFVL